MSSGAKPYDQLEVRIRDYLAEHLDILETDLSLVGKEYPITLDGRLGKVDLLARDESDCLVIIEIKRSKQATRQATQEIQQYAELLQQKHGIGPEMVRGIIASTDWSQVLPAFSNMVRHGDYHVDGYQLFLRDEVPYQATVVKPMKEPLPIIAAREHGIYLFSSAASRNEALSIISGSASENGLSDFIVMLLDYAGKNMSVVYGHACYLVPGAIDEATRLRVSQWVEERYSMTPSDVSETHVMREILVEVRRRIRVSQSPEYGDYEDGSPQVIATMLVDWSIDTISRAGRFNSDIFSDHQLVRMAARIESDNPYGFSWRGRPRFRPTWERMRESLRHFLRYNRTWLLALDWFLDKAAEEHANEYISVDVWEPYEPLNAVNKVAFHEDRRLLPRMVGAVESKEGFIYYVVGNILWDGQTFPALSDVLPGRGRLRDRVFRHLRCGGMPATVAHEVLARHGMVYSAVLVEAPPGGIECTYQMTADADGSSVHPVPTVVENLRTLVDFCCDLGNAPYLMELHEHLGVIVEL